MKMVKRNRKNSAKKGMWIIVVAAMFIIISAAIAKLAPAISDKLMASNLFSGNDVDQLDNTIGVNITEYYAPTIIKTDVDNNTCDLSIVVSREDLLRSIVNMNQLGTSETVIQTFWLPNGKPFQFSTTKSDAEKALALMDAYLENHPGLVSPPIENILNGVEETTASKEIKDTETTEDAEGTEESETTKKAEESEESEASETNEVESEAEANTTLINLYARYNVRVDCQFPEDGQYDRYYAAFHDYDIAALHNYCQRHDLLNYTIKGVKSNGAIWNVTISNYVFNNVQTEIDTNPKHASTFTVPVEMERVTTTTEPESKPESESKPENDSPGNSASENPDVATDEDCATPLVGESEKSSIFTPVVILAVIIAVLILIVIVLVIKIQSAKKRIQLIYEEQEYDDYINGKYEEISEEPDEGNEPEEPEEPEESNESNEPDESKEASPTTEANPIPVAARPGTVDDFFANYVNAHKK